MAVKSRWFGLALRVVVIAAVAVALWWFLRSLKLEDLSNAFAQAKLWPLVICAVLNFGILWGKAACWRIMLAPRYVVSTWRLMRYTIVAFAASAIAPARAGEVLRVWVLKRRDGVPASDSTAVAVAEKLLDGVSMLILVAPLPWLLPGLPDWVMVSLTACAVIAVVVFVGLFIAVGRVDGTSRSWLVRFVAGMHVLRSARRLAAALAVLLAVWGLDLASVMLVMYAVGIPLPVAGGLLVLFALNLAITLPSTPAQFGPLELGAVSALAVLHVPEGPAVVFALLYHAIQVLPLIAVGLVLELRLVLGKERLDEPA
jgi:uncharacterized membrane protein YbhN (UPF0104 family)